MGGGRVGVMTPATGDEERAALSFPNKSSLAQRLVQMVVGGMILFGKIHPGECLAEPRSANSTGLVFEGLTGNSRARSANWLRVDGADGWRQRRNGDLQLANPEARRICSKQSQRARRLHDDILPRLQMDAAQPAPVCGQQSNKRGGHARPARGLRRRSTAKVSSCRATPARTRQESNGRRSLGAGRRGWLACASFWPVPTGPQAAPGKP